MFQRLTASTAWLGLWMLLLFAGCQTQGGARSTAAPVAPKNIPHDQILTLGDVDPDEPVKKIKRFQPQGRPLNPNPPKEGVGSVS